jgi:cyclic beta-1,2-glucan synthetase
MWIAPVLAVALGMALAMAGSGPTTWLFAAPVLLLWLVSPAVGWWISRPLAAPTPGLSVDNRSSCAHRRAAPGATSRTSSVRMTTGCRPTTSRNIRRRPSPRAPRPPTSACRCWPTWPRYDFGYLTAGECLQRIGNTLASMEKLERYRGHFYNWYDTRTLQPLHPQYVSSVDSGNLAGSLLTLQAGLAELKHQPVLSANALQGLQDTLQVLAEQLPAAPAPELAKRISLLQDTLRALTLERLPQTLAAAASVLDEIHRIGGELVESLPTDIDIEGDLYYWAQAFDRQSRALRDELAFLVPDKMGSAHPDPDGTGRRGSSGRRDADRPHR